MALHIERLRLALELLKDISIYSDRADRERTEAIRHLEHCIRLEFEQPTKPTTLCAWCAYCPEYPKNFEYELYGEQTTRLSFCGTDCRKDFEQDNMTETQKATRQEV